MMPPASNDRSLSGPPSTLAGAVWGGFFVCVPLWLGWYVTHLPWTKLTEQQALPIVLSCWVIGLFVACRALRSPQPIRAGASIGLVSAAIGVLALGSKIVTPGPEGSGAPGAVVPNALWIVLGFLALGSILGAVAGMASGLLRGEGSPSAGRLDGMARVAVVLAAPLLFAGGLVTSTDSGMAVPDWPNTFGTNMFLYPLGPRVQPVVGKTYSGIYLEHAHRLFGALVGLVALCLTIWVLWRDKRRWVKIVTGAIFAFIVLQGYLGGKRVEMNERVLAMFHGVSAQLILAGLVCVSAFVSAAFRSEAPLPPIANARKIRIFTNAAVHAAILQLFLGALYRHFREGPAASHTLFTHIGFSIVVLGLGTVGGALAAGARGTGDGRHPLLSGLRIAGTFAVVLVGVQFILGWMALFLGGKGVAAPTAAHALLRTAHQANGAMMLAAMTYAAVYARRLTWLLGRAQA